MTAQKHKKQNKSKGGFNPVAAVVTGAIVGAGVAIAGTIALENKKNREEVKQVFTNLKNQAVGYLEKMQKKAEGKKGNVEKKLTTGQTEKKGQ